MTEILTTVSLRKTKGSRINQTTRKGFLNPGIASKVVEVHQKGVSSLTRVEELTLQKVNYKPKVKKNKVRSRRMWMRAKKTNRSKTNSITKKKTHRCCKKSLWKRERRSMKRT
jgi:hypothetical protein